MFLSIEMVICAGVVHTHLLENFTTADPTMVKCKAQNRALFLAETE